MSAPSQTPRKPPRDRERDSAALLRRNLNYGFRTLEVFQDRLFTGTAQCFFCDVRRPGTQVWELDVDCRSGAGVEYPIPPES